MNRYLLRKCCCGLSLQTGTQIIGVLSMLGGLGGLVLGIFLVVSTSAPKADVVIADRQMIWSLAVNQIIGSLVLIAVTVYLLVSATKNRKPMFLVPWLVWKSDSLFALVFYSLHFGIVGLLIVSVLYSYFWWVVYSYYHQLATVGTKMEAYQCNEKC